jgi:hypothetical protein
VDAALLVVAGLGFVLMVVGFYMAAASEREWRQREAERRIADISRRAQAALLNEAFRRAQHRSHQPTSSDQPGPPWSDWR